MTQPRQGRGPRLHEHRRAGRRSARSEADDGVQWSGTLTPAVAAAGQRVHAPAAAGRRLPRRCRRSANPPIPARRRDDHELQRADVLLRRRAVLADRRRLERLRRDRRGHRLPTSLRSRRRSRTRLGRTTSSPRSGRTSTRRAAARSASDTAQRRRRHAGSSSTTGRVKNFSDPTTHTVRDLDPARTAAHGAGRERADHDLVRRPRTPAAGDAGAPGDRNWGAENRDGTSGKNLASAPANNTQYSVNTVAADPRRVGDDPVRRVEQEGGHVPFGRDA